MKVSVVLESKGVDVYSVSPNDTVRDTLQFFASKQIGCAPVFDDGGEILGLITERDICNMIAKDGDAVVNRTVGEGLNNYVLSCTSDDRLPKVMALMTSHRTRHVLVRNDDGATVGIISIGDIVKHRLDEALEEEKALRDYIAGTGYSCHMDA
ncbi:CBS domain-containing protein [Kiloniella sp.]|uniref:CBS domain-containing protein n=1 Tax=Kiloniella sp. TaxID=1938587 RepID=UPI003B01FDE8